MTPFTCAPLWLNTTSAAPKSLPLVHHLPLIEAGVPLVRPFVEVAVLGLVGFAGVVRVLVFELVAAPEPVVLPPAGWAEASKAKLRSSTAAPRITRAVPLSRVRPERCSIVAMRKLVLVLAFLVVMIFVEDRQPATSNTRLTSPPTSAAISVSAEKGPDFDSEIKPIFQARCQPCHFQGGKVYAEMPFDKPETIQRLNTKLFTRIKDEKEREKIRQFLDQH